jgi:hypothetical protein
VTDAKHDSRHPTYPFQEGILAGLAVFFFRRATSVPLQLSSSRAVRLTLSLVIPLLVLASPDDRLVDPSTGNARHDGEAHDDVAPMRTHKHPNNYARHLFPLRHVCAPCSNRQASYRPSNPRGAHTDQP